MIKKIVFALIILISTLGCKETSTEPELKLNTVSGPAFGTTFNIQFYAHGFVDVPTGLDSIFNVVNNSVSTYLPDSDISRINKGDSTVVVDTIFTRVFALSAKIHKQSDGYFDPTVGVLRNAYGFGDTKPLRDLNKTVIDSLMQFVGFNKVLLNSNGTITKQNPNIYFDFNAIAKGYGIDCIANYLDSFGLENYLIELGGELVAKGINLNKKSSWVVGIESASSDLKDRTLQAKLKLQNSAMASSGNYRKFRVDSITGEQYVHTLNPLTGSAEKSDLTSATVLAATCAEADAYATTFMALGLEKSKELLNELSGIDVYFTYLVNGETQTFISSGFKEALLD